MLFSSPTSSHVRMPVLLVLTLVSWQDAGLFMPMGVQFVCCTPPIEMEVTDRNARGGRESDAGGVQRRWKLSGVEETGGETFAAATAGTAPCSLELEPQLSAATSHSELSHFSSTITTALFTLHPRASTYEGCVSELGAPYEERVRWEHPTGSSCLNWTLTSARCPGCGDLPVFHSMS